MKLRIETFSNVKGGSAFFKAIGHPLVTAKAYTLFAAFAQAGTVAVYDPLGLAVDSREVRERFNLGDFTGSLFIHVTGVAGHEMVKYALDTYGDSDEVLSCMHDANTWPSELYAGLPAPTPDEPEKHRKISGRWPRQKAFLNQE